MEAEGGRGCGWVVTGGYRMHEDKTDPLLSYTISSTAGHREWLIHCSLTTPLIASMIRPTW